MSRTPFFRFAFAAGLAVACLFSLPARAEVPPAADAQTIVHLLDYVGVDYGQAVGNGEVLDAAEYAEQVEFADQVTASLGELPANPQRAGLIDAARALAAEVRAKAPAERVAAAALALRQDLIAAYRVPVAPKTVPDLARARDTYRTRCAGCHGEHGHGDGPAAAALDPAPSDFHDAARMDQRSVYGLYNTISLGVAGTAMTGFPNLSESERWGLAFLVSNLRSEPPRLAQGRALWRQGRHHDAVPDLAALATLTAEDVGARHGDAAVAVFDYLRAEPQALAGERPAGLAFAASNLDRALESVRQGDRDGAQRIAIAAYLEGFEPVEASLDNLDPRLRRDIEAAMMAVRQDIAGGASAETLAQRVDEAKALLGQAGERLNAGSLSPAGAFAAALFILLREGLEAILVLAAVIAFVVRSGQRRALAYVHAGWGVALLLGGLTWAAATWLVDISGADREITEGVTALLASAMLVYVGYWLHDKAHAKAWQKFLHERVGAALARRTLWTLAGVAFLAVYRELFEIVLFYQALWAQTGEAARQALWAGVAAAVLGLAGSGWALFRFGIKLPLGPFFSGTAIFLGVLAVVFAGQGVAALQEAGVVASSPLAFFSLPLLGVFPTTQTLLAQATVALALMLFFWVAGRRRERA